MDLNMKPSLAADEMFSEGPGYMEMDEVSPQHNFSSKNMVFILVDNIAIKRIYFHLLSKQQSDKSTIFFRSSVSPRNRNMYLSFHLLATLFIILIVPMSRVFINAHGNILHKC